MILLEMRFLIKSTKNVYALLKLDNLIFKRNYSEYSKIASLNNNTNMNHDTMQAWITEEFNTSPVIRNLPIPQIFQENQLLLKVKVIVKILDYKK